MDLIDLCLRHWPALTQHGSLVLVLVVLWLNRRDIATKAGSDARERKRLAKLMRLHSDRHAETSRWLWDDDDDNDPPAAPAGTER